MGHTMSSIEYLGFDINGGACEIFLGDAFETHLPSRNRIVLHSRLGEQEAAPGDVLKKDAAGWWVRYSIRNGHPGSGGNTACPCSYQGLWARTRCPRTRGKQEGFAYARAR